MSHLKFLILFISVIGFPVFSWTQESCATGVYERLLATNNPDIADKVCSSDFQFAKYSEFSDLDNRSFIILPIVVHIVYHDAIENISDQQVMSQIEALNADFGLERLAANCPAEFSNHAAASNIRFCLADKDPSGLPSKGITRQYTSQQEIGLRTDADGRKRIHYSRKGGADGWDSQKYINIWICNLPDYLGYATRPGMAAYPEEDGIVIDYRSFGSLGTAIYPHNLGRTAVHEMGHFLGLLHIWGRNIGDCGSDLVADTPPQSGPYYNCPNYPVSSCNEHNMTMNFMDYTDDRCMYMFTQGQVNLMRGVLSSERKSLLEGANTACNDLYEKRLKDNISIFPSITQGSIHVHISEPGNRVLDFYLFAEDGKFAQEWNSVQAEYINLKLNPNIVPGIYFLQVRTQIDKSTFIVIII